MKLEIDIDEDYYKIICKRVEKNKPYHSPYEYEVIADGKPLEQEPRKDEVILTNKEYRELIANEYDNGYCKGYLVALEEQEPILDKIRAEIERLQKMCNEDDLNLMAQHHAFGMVLDILDKYKAETEDKNA